VKVENKNNKIYESLKADTELKEKILKESIKTIKTVSLPDDDELSLRRNEKMNNKEYSALFKKVIVASLSLIATGGIIAGVVSYSKNGGNKERLVTKETTSEYESTEKETDEILENIENKHKIKLNKKDQKEFVYVRAFYTDDNENDVLNNKIFGEVADNYFKKSKDIEFTASNGRPVSYFGVEETEFKNLINENNNEEEKDNSIFATNGKVVLYINNNIKKLSKYDIKTGEETEIVIPEYLRENDCDNSLYAYEIYNGILYIIEYIKDIPKNTYVYDISTGEYDHLLSAQVFAVLNDYVLIKDYTDQNDLHEKDYIKKITDDGLEDVMELDECLVCNGIIGEDYFSLVKKVKNNVSPTGENEESDWKEEDYGSFNTKTEKITLKNNDEHSVEMILDGNQGIVYYVQKGDLVDLRMIKATYDEIEAWINGESTNDKNSDELEKQFELSTFENLEVLDVQEFRRVESGGSFSFDKLVTFKVTKEQKGKIEKNLEKYGSRSYEIKLKPKR